MPYIIESDEKSVHQLALERIEFLYKRYDRVTVSFSGGKDSTVCLNLCIEVARSLGKLPVEAVFWDEEAIHPPTIEYMERVANNPDVYLRWMCLPIWQRNACSKDQPCWFAWSPEEEHLWTRPLPAKAITYLEGFDRRPVPRCGDLLFPADKHRGTLANIVGLRAQESLRRLKTVTARRYYNWISNYRGPSGLKATSNIYTAKPIYDWKVEDVWSAPKHFGWDYNHTYDVFTAAGIARHDQRVCPPYGEEPLRGLWQYKVCFPELWEKMIHRVKGANTAGIYSRSPLYGYNDARDSAPEGISFREAIVEELKRWPESERLKITERIKAEIRSHNRNTTNAPIPDVSQYGLNWKFLYGISKRGDIKQRKKIKLRPVKDVVAEFHARNADRHEE